ncbi:MAG: hypothetical protein L7S56_00390 [Candidatus Poseidonia sp.]|nr:hypothetical protein [Poseidonia sp.]
MGAKHISGSRRRNEPFNPFAKNASQEHERRKSAQSRQPSRRPTTPDVSPKETVDIKAELERKQREANEKLVEKGKVSAPAVRPAPVPQTNSEKKDSNSEPVSREDRLAELRRKSEALKKAAPSSPAQPSMEQEILEGVIDPVSPVENSEVAPEIIISESEATTGEMVTLPRVKNVFRKIETETKTPTNDRRRTRRRHDKKGGGRQKPERKLNRQKYLEYKYAAKDILDNPNVPEEHRSNVLGQVWAKGERISVEESISFIEQKELELILPAEVGQKLRDLVKRMTTKR